MLMTWNAFLASLDWFYSSFPSESPGFWLGLMSICSSVVLQPLTTLFGHHFTYNLRIVVPYILLSIILAITPAVVTFTNEKTGFILICVLIAIGGGLNAISEASIFTLAATLPDKFTNGVLIGNGLAGIFITCLRFICLGAFPQDSSGYLHSTELYFAISGGVLILCIIAQIHAMKNPLVIKYLENTQSVEAKAKVHIEKGIKISNNPPNDNCVNDDIELSPIPQIKLDNSLNRVKDNLNSSSLPLNGVEINLDDSIDRVKDNLNSSLSPLNGMEITRVLTFEDISYMQLLKSIWQYLFIVWVNFFITFGMLSQVALATDAR